MEVRPDGHERRGDGLVGLVGPLDRRTTAGAVAPSPVAVPVCRTGVCGALAGPGFGLAAALTAILTAILTAGLTLTAA